MGVGGFPCCSCKNIKESIYFEDEPPQKDDITKIEETPKIEKDKNAKSLKQSQNKINKNNSIITNQQLFKQSGLYLPTQKQDNDDDYDNLFNQIL